jgi:hypothetical protein
MVRNLDPRQHIRVHSGMPEHPKVEVLSDAAFRALVEAWCLCRRAGNDGRIPIAVWSKRWAAKPRRELIAAGLVHPDGDTVEVHDWLDHQPSAAELDSKRLARAEAGRKGGKRSGESRRGANRSGSTDDSNSSSESEANAKANASAIASPNPTEIDKNSVTADEISSTVSSPSEVPDSDATSTVSDTVRTPLPAETDPESEANASSLLEQLPKHSGSKVQPDKDKDKDISGHLVGDRYVSSEEISRNEAPPKYHPGHETGYVKRCADCERTGQAYERWLALRLADTEPPPHCPRHPEGSFGQPCRDCGRARERNTQWHKDRAHRAAVRQSEAARTAAADRARAIADCDMCDEHGYRDGRVCDHDPDSVARSRRGIAAVRIAACRMCDTEGRRADGTECDHKPPKAAETASSTPEPTDAPAEPPTSRTAAESTAPRSPAPERNHADD